MNYAPGQTSYVPTTMEQAGNFGAGTTNTGGTGAVAVCLTPVLSGATAGQCTAYSTSLAGDPALSTNAAAYVSSIYANVPKPNCTTYADPVHTLIFNARNVFNDTRRRPPAPPGAELRPRLSRAWSPLSRNRMRWRSGRWPTPRCSAFKSCSPKARCAASATCERSKPT